MGCTEVISTEELTIAARQRALGLAALRDGNALGMRYGLALTEPDMRMLAEKQAETLRSTGRVEFGAGPYGKLIQALCDSPYLSQATYVDTLAALCELFYQFKGESGERWSDDELVDEMARLFGGPCQGSVELLGDRLWQALHEPDPEPTEEEEPLEEE